MNIQCGCHPSRENGDRVNNVVYPAHVVSKCLKRYK